MLILNTAGGSVSVLGSGSVFTSEWVGALGWLRSRIAWAVARSSMFLYWRKAGWGV